MKLIESFSVDHNRIVPGIFVSRKDRVGSGVVTTYDVRLKRPNVEPVIDVAAMHSLEQFYERCKERDIHLVFSHVNEQPMHTMQKDGFVEKVGEENFRPHIDDAISWAEKLIV